MSAVYSELHRAIGSAPLVAPRDGDTITPLLLALGPARRPAASNAAAYQNPLVTALRELTKDHDRRRGILQRAQPLLLSDHLDLTPALPILEADYASSPRGGTPWAPISVLRALLLGHLIGGASAKWRHLQLRTDQPF